MIVAINVKWARQDCSSLRNRILAVMVCVCVW